ncbi:MAG TPA: hypothetical protein VD814_10130 [Nocardioides sp.]|nr:hypothetical protein [Nocardioides sp.]
MSGHEQDTDIHDSTPNATGPQRSAGGMGVSSERTGHTGPGQHSTTGTKDVHAVEPDPDADVPPEQAPGAVEENPAGLGPKAGYPKADPRSVDEDAQPQRPSRPRNLE